MTSDAAPATTDRQSGERLLGLLAATLLLWLVTRPYSGVVQDARFYMLEALHDQDPGRYAHDLYFQFGSQGRFSVFSWMYRPLLPLLGIGATGIVLTIIGQALWLAGLFCLARNLAGRSAMWLSIAMVIGVLNLYAPYFAYGEAFVTPRLYAEGLTMLALALLPARPALALVILCVSASLHPLMTLPGLAVAFIYLAIGRPLWWGVAAAGVVVGVGLGFAGIPPFSNLFRTIDPAWFAVIKVRQIQCLLTSWPSDSFVQVGGVLAWAVFALATVGKQHRRLLGATLAVGVGGLALTYLGGDIARNVLVVEIQPWRALWLLEVVTRIYIPLIFLSLLANSGLGAMRMATFLSMALILVSCVTRLVRYPNSAEFTPVSLALEAAALAAMAMLLLMPSRRIAQIAAIAAALLIPAGLWRWDSRTPWTRFVESPAPPPRALAALLPPTASVYWEGSVETLWFRLRRASYYSCDQGTGGVFYRDIAMAYRDRADNFWPLRVSDFHLSDACASFAPLEKPERTRKGLQNLCIREPGLDYLVLSAPLDGAEAKVWESPVRFEDIHMSDGRFFQRITDHFYVYACAGLR